MPYRPHQALQVRLTAWLLLAAAAIAPARAAEENAWPFRVVEHDAPSGAVTNVKALGPLYEARFAADGSTTEAWRPFLLQARTPNSEANYLLYPFFAWKTEPGYRSFSFFQLVNYRHETDAADKTASPAAGEKHFDIWPFYFSRETGDRATSYHALFPVAGTVKQRFGKDRLTWYAFPLYLNTDRAGMEITSAPWPFIRVIRGAGHHGFEFWPLFGQREHPGDYRKQFYLWPFGYRQETHLSDPQPDVKLGVLPFYARDTGPGYISETYLWPFFGYTDRTQPVRYHETRYFWPLLVQGRGESKYVNRWAPFYTHSNSKGYDKTWVLWPLYRRAHWDEHNVAQTQDRVLLFLYWSLEQRSLTNPAAAPASKRHLWPLFSAWDNGAGRKQVQVLSPLEVFFQNNDVVRQLYTPIFAIYRYDQRAPDDARHTVLWGLVSWRKNAASREFHLGPLGWRRDASAPRGRFFLFASSSSSDTKASAASTP